MDKVFQNLEELSRFKFNFYLDIRKPLKSGLYSIKINLYDKAIRKHINFTIKRVTGIEVSSSEKDWIDIWKNKDKIDSFGEVKGETTVYGRKFEIRTILKAKQDILNELIMRDDIISLQEVKDGFYNHKAKEKFDDDLYEHLDNAYKYQRKVESYSYADGFITTKKNIKRYMNKKPLKLTQITKRWLDDYTAKRKLTVSSSAVKKDLVNVRTVYNKAKADNDILKLKYPFGGVGYKMPKSKTKNQSLTKEQLILIKDFSSKNRYHQRARDMFLASFYMMGANLTDVARLEKNQKIYTRKKTKKTSGVKLRVSEINDDMLDIIERNKGIGKYVFNILDDDMNEEKRLRRIRSETKKTTSYMKEVAKILNFPEDVNLMLMLARHSVATHLVLKGVSMKAVQEAYQHTTMRTTEGYVDTLIDKEKEQIDDALDLEI